MFDTYVDRRPSGPSRIDVHEHRAPTDESVKLMKEMESATERNRIASMPLQSNILSGVVSVFQDHVRASVGAVAVFDLNGHRCRVTADVPAWGNQGDLLVKLHEEVAKRVAEELLVKFTSTDAQNLLLKYSKARS